MRDDPAKNLKWLAQQLLEEEAPPTFSQEDEELIRRVDTLIGEISQEETPMGDFSCKSRGARTEAAHIRQQFDESAAIPTMTKQQLRQEAKLLKKAEKKANINRNIRRLVFLAVLECIGILIILGWWLQ